jgi:hypothetical protein
LRVVFLDIEVHHDGRVTKRAVFLHPSLPTS